MAVSSGSAVFSSARSPFSAIQDCWASAFPMAAILTGDADIAQDYAISREVEDSLPPIVELLQGVDASFRPVPHRSGSAASSAFQNADGYRVEFLTSNRGSDDHIDQPAKMPALGGASADPLRFLDYLIREPVKTMLLHRSGVPVVVPDPSRYAVHKLIVASRRHTDGQGAAKREKDVRQAALLFEALQQTRRSADLALVYNEAWERGIAWQEAISNRGGDAAHTRCRAIQDGSDRGGQEKQGRHRAPVRRIGYHLSTRQVSDLFRRGEDKCAENSSPIKAADGTLARSWKANRYRSMRQPSCSSACRAIFSSPLALHGSRMPRPTL